MNWFLSLIHGDAYSRKGYLPALTCIVAGLITTSFIFELAFDEFSENFFVCALSSALTAFVIAVVITACSVKYWLSSLWTAVGWQKISGGILFVGASAFVGEVVLHSVVYQILEGEHSLSSAAVIAILSGLSVVPVLLWLIWLAEWEASSQKGSDTQLPPERAIATAMLVALVMLGSVSFYDTIGGLRIWERSQNTGELINLAGRQRMLAQSVARFSIVPQTGITPWAQSAARLKLASEELAFDGIRLDALMYQKHMPWVSADHKLVELYNNARTYRLRIIKLANELAEKPNAILANVLQDAVDIFIPQMDQSVGHIEQFADWDAERGLASKQTNAIIAPLMLLLLGLGIAYPVIMIVRRQHHVVRQAHEETNAALVELKAYQTALDSHFSVTVSDLEGKIVHANKRCCELTGYEQSELVGHDYTILDSGKHSSNLFEEMWNAMQKGSVWQGEICDKTKDGRELWLDTIVFPMFTKAGDIDRFVSIAADVTRSKREAATLQVMIDHFPGGIALIDEELNIAVSNERYGQLLDLPEEMFAGGSLNLSDITRFNACRGDYGAGDTEEIVQQRLSRLARPEAHFYERETATRSLEVRGLPIPGGGLVTTYVDVTDKKAAEKESSLSRAKLEAFVKHTPAAVAMLDQDLRYVAYSNRWLEEYDLDETSLIGRSHYDVFPDIAEKWKTIHARCLAGAVETSPKEILERADGSTLIIRWEIRPWFLEDGEVGGILMLTEEITERVEFENELWRGANFDSLTELPNRAYFTESFEKRLERAGGTEQRFYVGLLDIDHFKYVNDTFGHDAGDRLIQEFAVRLRENWGDAGMVARLGGDEFAVMFNADVFEDTADLVHGLYQTLLEPIDIGSTLHKCSMSMGVAEFPRDAKSYSRLLKCADLALYEAKNQGKNRCYEYGNARRCVSDPDTRLATEAA
ncbi:MAG: diguanylate cyclase [Filomicrobium sp.]